MSRTSPSWNVRPVGACSAAAVACALLQTVAAQAAPLEPGFVGLRAACPPAVAAQVRFSDFVAAGDEGEEALFAELERELDGRAAALAADGKRPLVLLSVGQGELEAGAWDSSEDAGRRLYNRWLSWLHRLAGRLAPRVDAWVLETGGASSAGPFAAAHPLHSQLLKSSATELRSTDRDAQIFWGTEPPADLAPWWPEGSLAYLDGLVVPAGASAAPVRSLLPRADFELWLRHAAPAGLPAREAALAELLAAQRDGVQGVLWRESAGAAAAALEAWRLLPELTGPEWAPSAAVQLEAPAGRRGFVLLDAEGRRVRVVLLGAGAAGAAQAVRVGLGRPHEARWRVPGTGRSGALRMGKAGADLLLEGVPAEPIVVLELPGALPLVFEAVATGEGELAGDEVMARAEAYQFWLRRAARHLACRLQVEWQAGPASGSVDTELLFEPASATVWLHILGETKGGLSFDPNQERFLFFERGGGVATPLVQAVDEDHDYRRLPDVERAGRRLVVVEFTPLPGARRRTAGTYWLDPRSYAIVRLAVDDRAPGFPMTHTESRMEFQELPGGVWIPGSGEEVSSGTIFGFSFSGRNRLRFEQCEVAPEDVPQRIERAIASPFPVLVWNEQKDEMVVLRKKGRRGRGKQDDPAAAGQAADSAGAAAGQTAVTAEAEADYLLQVVFGQGLEDVGHGAPAGAAEAAASGRFAALGAEVRGMPDGRPASLERLARTIGDVELLRGGDPKRLSNWIFGFAGARDRLGPLVLYTRVYLEWLGRRDWQLAVVTAGVFSVLRWTDAHLAGSSWSGSLTAVLPLIPGAQGFYDRGEDALDDQELRRLSPSLGVSVHRPLGQRLAMDAGAGVTLQYFGRTDETSASFVEPRTHLETRLHLQLEYRAPRSGVFFLGELGLRSAWGAWGYGTHEPPSHFTRLQAGAEKSFGVGRTGVVTLAARGGAGAELDRFSGFALSSPGGFALSSRLVLPVGEALASRYAGLEAAAETSVRKKLRLGVEGAWAVASDEELLGTGVERSGEQRQFASLGLTAGFNFPWNSQARVRLGVAAELGDEGEALPSAGYVSFLVSRTR